MTSLKKSDLVSVAQHATSAEEKLAAVITAEAVEPEGMLEDPELVTELAEGVQGDRLGDALVGLAKGTGPRR